MPTSKQAEVGGFFIFFLKISNIKTNMTCFVPEPNHVDTSFIGASARSDDGDSTINQMLMALIRVESFVIKGDILEQVVNKRAELSGLFFNCLYDANDAIMFGTSDRPLTES